MQYYAIAAVTITLMAAMIYTALKRPKHPHAKEQTPETDEQQAEKPTNDQNQQTV